MSLTGIGKVPRVYSVSPTGDMALNIFCEGKAGRSPQLRKREAPRIDEQFSASPPDITTQQSKSLLVRAIENVTVAPQCRQKVLGRLESEKEQNLPPLVCVEPAQLPLKKFSLPVDLHKSIRVHKNLPE